MSLISRKSVWAALIITALFSRSAVAHGHGATRLDDNVVLRGKVVNSVNAAPVRGALVQLLGEKPRAVLSEADGTFSFDNLAPGDAVIAVRKPGYFSAREYYPESVGEQHVHLALQMPAIELKLFPEAVVFGRVMNESGRPLEGFNVELVRASAGRSPADRPQSPIPTAVTNENGEYRLAELHGGNYLIRVERKMDANGPIALFQASKFRTGYPAYFYPNVTDPSSATPVRLAPGKQFEANLRLASQPLYRVTGSVQGASGNGPILVVLVAPHDENPVAAAAILPGLPSFVLEGVPSGNYLLGAIQPQEGSGRGEKTGIAGQIEVRQNLEGASIVLSEQTRVAVRFRYQFAQSTGNPAEGLGAPVSLQRTDLPMEVNLFSATLMPNPNSPDEAVEIGLDPGTYRAQLNVQPNRCVASVKSGIVDLLTEDLVVSGEGSVEPLEVVIRDDCARIAGLVSKEGQPSMGRVLLIPEDVPQRHVSMAANSDGAFEFQGLLPGKYLAVALDGADDLDLSDTETLTKVKARATPVELPAAGTANVRLQLETLEP